MDIYILPKSIYINNRKCCLLKQIPIPHHNWGHY